MNYSQSVKIIILFTIILPNISSRRLKGVELVLKQKCIEELSHNNIHIFNSASPKSGLIHAFSFIKQSHFNQETETQQKGKHSDKRFLELWYNDIYDTMTMEENIKYFYVDTPRTHCERLYSDGPIDLNISNGPIDLNISNEPIDLNISTPMKPVDRCLNEIWNLTEVFDDTEPKGILKKVLYMFILDDFINTEFMKGYYKEILKNINSIIETKHGIFDNAYYYCRSQRFFEKALKNKDITSAAKSRISVKIRPKYRTLKDLQERQTSTNCMNDFKDFHFSRSHSSTGNKAVQYSITIWKHSDFNQETDSQKKGIHSDKQYVKLWYDNIYKIIQKNIKIFNFDTPRKYCEKKCCTRLSQVNTCLKEIRKLTETVDDSEPKVIVNNVLYIFNKDDFTNTKFLKGYFKESNKKIYDTIKCTRHRNIFPSVYKYCRSKSFLNKVLNNEGITLSANSSEFKPPKKKQKKTGSMDLTMK